MSRHYVLPPKPVLHVFVPVHQSEQQLCQSPAAKGIDDPTLILKFPPFDGVGVVPITWSNRNAILDRVQQQFHILDILKAPKAGCVKLHLSLRYLRPSLPLLVAIANALEVSVDDILVDNLTHPNATTGDAIHTLLLDCNDNEKNILTKTMTFMKALLSEYGV